MSPIFRLHPQTKKKGSNKFPQVSNKNIISSSSLTDDDSESIPSAKSRMLDERNDDGYKLSYHIVTSSMKEVFIMPCEVSMRVVEE